MEQWIEQLGALWPLLISAAKALVVLVVGWIAAGVISGAVRRRINATPHLDQTLGNFAASAVRWVLLAIVLVAVLGIFGIEATSLVAMLGAATLAIGLALQGTLSDLAAGVMLVMFRPYKLGQYVDIGGTSGTVVDLNLFVTELVTPDNVQIIIPNSAVWSSSITNYSSYPRRRVDLVVGVGYGADLKVAEAALRGVMEGDARALKEPGAFLMVTGLGDSAVDLTMRVWCAAEDYWGLKFDLTRAGKEALNAAGVDIPFPTRTIIQS